MSRTRFSVLVRLVNGPEWRTHPMHELGLLTQISKDAEQGIASDGQELFSLCFMFVSGVSVLVFISFFW